MSDEWRWVGADGFEYSGSIGRLRQALASGELAPNTPVWRAGFSAWVAAESVHELAAPTQAGPLPSFALESRPFAPVPEMKTPPPVGISADHVVVAAPGGQMQALSPPAPPAAHAYAPAAREQPRRSRLLLPAAIGGVLLLGGLGAVVVLVGSRASEKTGEKPVGASGAAPAASASGGQTAAATGSATCRVNRTKPLAKAVFGKIPLIVSPRPDTSALVVGFAETRLLAHAISVDPETLAVRESKDERAPAPIVGVVPIGADKTVSLAIDVEDPRISARRTIEAEPRFSIGLGKAGFAKLDQAGRLETIWEGEADAETTVPRVDGSAALGFFIAVRRGGLGGRLLAGWLGADGKTRSGLVPITIAGSQVGTPTAAVGPTGVVLAAAVRSGADAPWDVHLGHAEPSKLPGRLSALAAPRAADAQRMSPALAALPGGRWALQWTERAGEGHVVRALLLDDELEPLSEAITVSPAGADSGQGELWARQDRLVSLYLVKADSGHELWASVIGCD